MFLHETIILPKEDTYFQYDLWEDGKSDVLLITGLVGSGKSTLGRQMAEEEGCEFYELDWMEHAMRETLGKDADKLRDSEFRRKYATDFFKTRILNKRFRGKRVIVEGVKVMRMDRDYMATFPIIIKETSAVVSSVRAINRERKRDEENIFQNVHTTLKYNKRFIKLVKEFKKDLGIR